MQFRDEPCARCGWKFKTFHICVDLSKPCVGEHVEKPARQKRQARDEFNERQLRIIALYIEGKTMRQLADMYSVDPKTIGYLLKRAEENDLVTIRQKGARKKEVADAVS